MAKRVAKKKPVSHEKLKDMVESILPCKAHYRKTAYYFKRMERRRVRHIVSINLRTCDQEGYTDRNLGLKPYQTRNVSDRRVYDKVNHFMRWGERLTEGLPKQEALGYIRKLLPHNVIGDHAYSHWEIHVERMFRQKYQARLKQIIRNEGGSSWATSFLVV